MKTFKDLEFEIHPIAQEIKSVSGSFGIYVDAKQARVDFHNGWGISVVFGKMFYSNGIDTYEIGCFKNGELTNFPWMDDCVIGRLSEKEITEIMIKLQHYDG